LSHLTSFEDFSLNITEKKKQKQKANKKQKAKTTTTTTKKKKPTSLPLLEVMKNNRLGFCI
jgi:hypothetical protein